MASVFNNIAVWGTTVDEYGSSSYTISGGNTPGFAAGNLIYAQQVNKAFRNATIVPYAIAQMMTGVNVGSSFNIGFDVDPANIAAFASSFKTVFNSYIQSAIKVNSASMADAASAFSTARTIRLTGDVTGSAASTGVTGWAFSTTIGASKVLTRMISANAVTSAKIATSAVISSKISDNAITSAKIATSAIISDKISANAVTTAKIADNAITTTKIGNSQVTNAKLATPWTAFTNSNTATTVTLASTRSLRDLFGFNTTDLTGAVKFRGEGLGYFYVDPDEEGDALTIIPGYFAATLPIESAIFPYASAVGVHAFENCSKLSSIYMPNVSFVGESAFYNCSSLVLTNINNYKYIGSNAIVNNIIRTSSISLRSEITKLNEGNFSGCIFSLFTTGEFNSPYASEIGSNCFALCSGISSAYFGNLDIINNNAFNKCSINERLTLSFNNSSYGKGYIGETALQNLYNLKELYINGEFGFLNSHSKIRAFTLSTLSIKNFSGTLYFSKSRDSGTSNEFSNMEFGLYVNKGDLKNIYAPNIESIDTQTEISPDTTYWSGVISMNVTNLKYCNLSIFSNVSNFTGSTHNIFINGMNNFYFQGNSKISGSITFLGSFSSSTSGLRFNFSNCTNISSIYMPNKSCSTTIGISTFYNCQKLTTIEMNHVTDLYLENYRSSWATNPQSRPFYNCSKITTLDLFSIKTISVSRSEYPYTYITSYMYFFANLINLEKLYLRSTSMVLLGISGGNMSSYSSQFATLFEGTKLKTTGAIYVPTSLLKTYRNNPSWAATGVNFIGF